MSRLGILGGTFDPFHKGHESIGLHALEEGDLDYLYLLPANVSPFKIGKKMAPEEDRIAMLKAYCRSREEFQLSTLEIDTDKVSYTYETMEQLKTLRPDDELFFIMGTDSFLSLEKWYKGKELLESTSIIVGKRNGINDDDLEKLVQHYEKAYNADILIMKNSILEISSTEIKKNISKGESIGHLVPKVIEEYIEKYGLYR
ncbi:MAG: nicotinate-nucleotide adenylyltransferase [Peptostreptococcaceae bacterium]|nr:nicotinate-nucleotide adenylyltransferase [Peptostreptococcaceae bacterium]MDY5738992.1 nicotinate-nucleotide adenylyltransferase [Anaerovoracaceae bacterium]SFE08997.1 nicotinate-nucleotide adenylyltransferase [Peptostreptococcaceae bacterium pGA-8]